MTAAAYSTRLHLPLPAGGDFDTRDNHNELITQAELYIADKATTDAHAAAAAPHSGHETPTGAQTKVNTHNADVSAHSWAATAASVTAHQTASPIDHPNNSVTDAKIQQYTLVPANVGSNGPFNLGAILNAFADRLKSAKGSTNWWDAPAATLAQLASHLSNLSNPHATTAAQVGAIPTSGGTWTNGTLAGTINGTPSWAAGQTFPAVVSTNYLQAQDGVVYLDAATTHYFQWYPAGGFYLVGGGAEMQINNSWVVTEINSRTLSNKVLASPQLTGTLSGSGSISISGGIFTSSTGTFSGTIIGTSGIVVSGATPNTGVGQFAIASQSGVGNGSDTGMVAPVHGSGSGPNNPQLIRMWMQCQLAGAIWWIPMAQ